MYPCVNIALGLRLYKKTSSLFDIDDYGGGEGERTKFYGSFHHRVRFYIDGDVLDTFSNKELGVNIFEINYFNLQFNHHSSVL